MSSGAPRRRSLGRRRYDFAGACCFAGLTSYRLSISFKAVPGDAGHLQPQVRQPCPARRALVRTSAVC
jgi:hypothetical protein